MRSVVKQMVVGLAVISLVSLGIGAEKTKKEGPLDTQAFVLKVGQINYGEITAGKLASKHASREEVKQYGQMLTEDHQKANQELLKLAAKNKWTVAGGPDEKHRMMAEKLGQLEGTEFDRSFLHHMVMGHKEAIQLFESQAKDDSNADLKAFVEMTLPTLKKHLKEAEKLENGAGKRDKER